MPAQAREAVEVRIGRNHGAAVLDSDGGMLRVGDELAGGAGTAAEILEDLEMPGAGANDMRVAPPGQLADETKDLVVGRGSPEDPWIRHDSNQSRQSEAGEREGFTPSREISQPSSVGGVLLTRIGSVGVDQHVDVR